MSMNVRRAQDDSTRWVTFELAGQLYGLEILKVQEVLADTEIESVPGAAAQILGVANLRGAIVTILDLRLRLGRLQQPQGRLHRVPLRPVQPTRPLPRAHRVPGRHLHRAVAPRRLVHHRGAHRQRHPLPHVRPRRL